MKTLSTLIACLFVVNTANAEDKWEYITMVFKEYTSIDFKLFQSREFEGFYKGKKIGYSYELYSEENKSDDKALEFNLSSDTLQDRNYVFKTNFGKTFKPDESYTSAVTEYINFFGGLGYELVMTIDRTKEFNEKVQRFIPEQKSKFFFHRAYILKRKTN